MKRWSWASGVFVTCFSVAAAQEAGPVKHVVVYNEPGRFAGWPANNGIWSWGDEIVVGFTLGYFKEKPDGHPIDPEKPEVRRLARSRDGGNSWVIEIPSFLDDQGKEKEPGECPGGIDFTHPDFALMVRMQGSNHGYSYFYWSNDRCKTWQGPYWLPTFDRKGVFGRTDYLINSRHDLMVFLTAAKEDGGEGRPFCARTTDGGKTWQFVSWICEEPETGGYAIMPSTVRLSHMGLLTFIRWRGRAEDGQRIWWIEPYLSDDNGQTWRLLAEHKIDNAGNPAHLIKLRDNRIAVTYGYRRSPYGIRARISADQGKTWGNEIILRDDGGEWDLGYPRTAEREDGKLVTVYYFNDKTQRERYIAATIWHPGGI